MVDTAGVKLAGSWGTLALGYGAGSVQLGAGRGGSPAGTAPVDGADGSRAGGVMKLGAGVRLGGIWDVWPPGGARAGRLCTPLTAVRAVLFLESNSDAAGLALTPSEGTPDNPLGAAMTAAGGLPVAMRPAAAKIGVGRVATVAAEVAAVAAGVAAVAAGVAAVAAGAAAVAAGAAAVAVESIMGTPLFLALPGANDPSAAQTGAVWDVKVGVCRGLGAPGSVFTCPAAGSAGAWRNADGAAKLGPPVCEVGFSTGRGDGIRILTALLPSSEATGMAAALEGAGVLQERVASCLPAVSLT